MRAKTIVQPLRKDTTAAMAEPRPSPSPESSSIAPQPAAISAMATALPRFMAVFFAPRRAN